VLIQNYFETRLEYIEEGLGQSIKCFSNLPVQLQEAIHYAVFSGGKRWRPLLVIAAYEMLTGIQKKSKLKHVINGACAVELMHNASIVHDDLPSLMNRKERRGKEALHQKYDNVIAIMAGDAMINKAFELLATIQDAAKATQCIRLLAKASSSYGMIGGQVVHLINKRKQMKINTLRYIDMKKVGSLLQAATDIACTLAEADDNVRQILSNYALNLGMAYMMIEDIIDDYGNVSDFDFDMEYTGTSKSGYAGLMGFDKARKQVEKLLDDSTRSLKQFDNNEVLFEFVQMIKDRLP